MSRQSSVTTEERNHSLPLAESDEIKASIRRRAAEISREELQTALTRLESQGGLTEAQERILQEMTTSLMDELLRAPESMLDETENLDRSTRSAIVELFDPNK